MPALSRRSFIQRLAAGGAALTVLSGSRPVRGYVANEKLGVALVGAGGRGSWFVSAIPALGENVVALCDVDERRAAESYAKLPGARRFRDFRRMLDEMAREIDAVIVATPDNTHALIAMAAMKMGKHVLCEKPLAHDAGEARALRAEAARRKVATQQGNQGTASEAFRRGWELIAAGVLGEVSEVHAWNTGGGPGRRPAPEGTPPVPETLEWDLWLGPARERPYHREWMRWHGWRDFGTGQLGNWASHTLNLAFRALAVGDLWRPARAASAGGAAAVASTSPAPRIRVEAEVEARASATFPRWEVVRYTIPARGRLPPVRLAWYNGAGRIPSARERIEEMVGRKLDLGDEGERKWRDHAGCVIAGSRGVMHLNAHNTEMSLHPEERFRDLDGPPRSLPRSPGHEREWLRASRGGPPAMSSFEASGPVAELVLLGNVATRFEEPLEYDPQAGKIASNAEADAALRREYRKGWSL